VKSQCETLGISALFEKSDIHARAAGAIPKDGPSAGWRCTPRCLTAHGRTVRHDVR